MFDDKYHDRNDALGQRLQRIGGQMNPSPELKKAAKTGVPLRPAGLRYTAGTHIRKFSKAVLAYAAGIVLFLGAILLIPKWWGGNELTPGGSIDPIITSKPIETIAPAVTEECKHLWVSSDNTPSCTEGCYKYTGCDLCGLSSTAWEDALGHDFVDGICTRCGEAERPAPADCEHGKEPSACPYCNCDEHEFVITSTEVTNPCIQNQVEIHTCKKCGLGYDVITAAPGHFYENGVCTMCGEIESGCLAIFAEGLAKAGKSITVSRELTAEEVAIVEAFVTSEEVRAVLSAAWYEPFYRPEDMHLYEILYADNTNIISEEEAILLKGDPQWVSDWSRMTTDEIKSMAKQYLGIEVTQAMLDAMLEEQVYIEGEVTAAGAVYLAEYDAYYRHHTDAGGMYPSEISGWLTADGKLLLHMISRGGDMDHILALLCPTEDGYLIEAAQWIDKRIVPDCEVVPD